MSRRRPIGSGSIQGDSEFPKGPRSMWYPGFFSQREGPVPPLILGSLAQWKLRGYLADLASWRSGEILILSLESCLLTLDRWVIQEYSLASPWK